MTTDPKSPKPVVVLFETHYGHSRKVAEHIVDLALRVGVEAHPLPIGIARAVTLTKYRAVVVVAPVRFGRHSRRLRRFLRQHADTLRPLPVAFVSVSNNAAAHVADLRNQATILAKRFAMETRIEAWPVITAGGALAYPRYPLPLRWIMRRIAARAGVPTDTSRAHELTVWPELDASLMPFLERLAPRDAETPPASSRVPIAAAP